MLAPLSNYWGGGGWPPPGPPPPPPPLPTHMFCGGAPSYVISLESIAFKTLKLKIVEFANMIDPEKAHHDEPSHLDLYCFRISIVCIRKFCRLLCGARRS